MFRTRAIVMILFMQQVKPISLARGLLLNQLWLLRSIHGCVTLQHFARRHVFRCMFFLCQQL